ncbi:putative ribonuclease H-like domain-containing protein [Tanacetum coccineum]
MDFIEFCGSKGINREYNNARTPQQNGVAERKNRTLIEAAKTMLADSFLPNTFWAEVVSTACYVLNRVLVTKPQNKTPYELITGEKPKKSNEKPVNQEDQAFLEELERLKSQEKEANDAAETLRKEFAQDTEDLLLQAGAARASSTNTVNTASTPDSYDNPNDGIFTNASYDDEGAVDDFTNLETIVTVSPISTSRIHSVHPSTQILRDPKSAVQTRSKVNKSSGAHAFVYRNKKDERGIVVRNKARLVTQGHRQEKGIDYDEVFALVARIEAIRIFLAFASYMGFIVYQMDVKSSFLYDTIDEEVYVSQPPGFVDPKCPKKVYKVVKALYRLHQAPKAWYATLSTFLLKSGYRRGTIDKTLFIKKDKNDIMLVQVYVDDIIFGSTKRSWCDEFEALMKSRFQMSSMGELTFFLGLQVKQKEDGIFISQDKYVAEILKKFDFASVKTASTPIETQKPLVKDEEASDVDVHLYRSMIGSLMYLTASRPDIMFAVCACSRFQVTPKTSHLNAVKRIFRYLKGKPKLGLWYPRVSSFDLEAYSDSDYAGANLDRKSTTGEAKYVAAANCCRQVLWIQNQMLDYGFNFMNIKIYIDNGSTICIIKNPVFHSKTKHIEIRHHFIRDAYEKKLIQVLKIHTDDNVADLLTKAFDVSSLYEVFCEQKNLDDGDVFHRVIWVPESNWRELSMFWMSAKSKTINNVRYITAIVAGKPVTISEASIRSDLLFDDADGIDTLNNQAIFDTIQLIGFEGDLILKNVPIPLDHCPINTLTSKVLSFMVKKSKHFSRNVTPLFDSMLVQLIKDEGEASERPSEPQPIPSPSHPSEDQPKSQPNPSPKPSPSIAITDSNPEGSGGNHKGQSSIDKSLSGNEDGLTLQSVYDLYVSLCKQVIIQAKEIKDLKAQLKKLKKKARPVITYHKA